MDVYTPTLYLLPVFFALIVVEALWTVRVRHESYAWSESLTSLAVMIGHRAVQFATAGVVFGVSNWVYAHRVATIPLDTPLAFIGLFLGLELLYYWYHRLSHELRWMWASHSVHHTPNRLNMTAAYRLSWTSLLSGNLLFWLPLMSSHFSLARPYCASATSSRRMTTLCIPFGTSDTRSTRSPS